MTHEQNYIRRIQQGATVPHRTHLQALTETLCDADHATITNGWQREISNIICTVDELTTAVQEEYLDRWADGVFRLFDPYDYQLYRVYAETTDPLLAITTSPGERA